MKICRLLTCMALLGLAPVFSHAQTSAPKYSNDFLQVGISARAAGMGNAMTAWVDDVTAGYWNPAGLVNVDKRHEFGLMHQERFAGVAKYDYAGFTTRLEQGRRLGVSIIRSAVDDIPNTQWFYDGNSFNYSKLSSFSVSDMALLVSYAQKVAQVEGLSFGTNVKVVNRNIGPFANAWGFGLDAGVQYRRDNLRLGAMAMDVTNTFNAWTFNTDQFNPAAFSSNPDSTQNQLPKNSVELTLPSLRLGGGYNFLSRHVFNLGVCYDAILTFDGKRGAVFDIGRVGYDNRIGMELSYKKMVFLRGGAMNFQHVPDDNGHRHLSCFPTVGVGFNYKFVQVDYALSNVSNFSDKLYSHLISLRFFFNEIKL